MGGGLASGGRGENLLPLPTQAGSAHPSARAPSRSPWSHPGDEDYYRCLGAWASGLRTRCLPPKYRLEGRLSSERLFSAARRPVPTWEPPPRTLFLPSVFPTLAALPFHLISPEQGGRKVEISEIRHFRTYFWPRMDRGMHGFLPHSRLPRPTCGI